jgi:hypothetical protein
VSDEKPLGAIEFHRSGEWTGVYLDGKLVRYGDHYLADEWLAERAGVTIIDSDDWLPDGRTPLGTLEEVAAEGARRERLIQEAKDRRDRAAALIADAERLEAKAKGQRS